MKYTDFSDEFLVAAYRESRLRPGETIPSGDLIDRYPLVFEPGWVVQLVKDLGVRGYFTSKGVDADDRGQPIRLTGRGLRVAEELIDKGIGTFRLDLGDGIGFPPGDQVITADGDDAKQQRRLNQDELYLLGLLLAECDENIGTIFNLKEFETESFSKRQVRESAEALHALGLASFSNIAVPGQRKADDMLMLTPRGIAYALKHEAQVLKAMMSGGSVTYLQRVREAFDRLGAEHDLDDPNGSAGVLAPASDRVVRIDHNDPAATQIREAAVELKQRIRRGNDLGEITPDQAEAVAAEIEDLERTFEGGVVRQQTLAERAKRTLKWVGDKAAGTFVGQAALALLRLILAFLGVG